MEISVLMKNIEKPLNGKKTCTTKCLNRKVNKNELFKQ